MWNWQKAVFDECGVEILGTELDAIEKAEDRDKFRELMYELGEPVPESVIVHSVEEAVEFANTNGYPVVVRPAFTLGGTGGGFANNLEELEVILRKWFKVISGSSVLDSNKALPDIKKSNMKLCVIMQIMQLLSARWKTSIRLVFIPGYFIVVAPTQTLTIVNAV